MVTKLSRLLKNPLVRQAITWGAPILLGWLLSKLDKSSSTGRKK